VKRWEAAVPAGLVTVIGPDLARFGIVNVSFVADTALKCAGTPRIVTEVVVARFVPVRVTFVPALPLGGAMVAIVGTGAVSGRKPSFTKIA
jgi:hypothetical protein